MSIIDLHLHGSPSIVKRMNPWDYVQEMDAAGYRACVIQDHSGSTAGLAYAIANAPVKLNIQVFGTLVMNGCAGGIRAAAVESAHRMGVRRISFPTTSSPQQEAYLKKHNLVFGGGSLKCHEEQVSPLDENGNLTVDAQEVLDYVKANPELILTTGYMSPAETEAVLTRVKELGIERFMIDHPYAIVEAETDLIRSWAERGAMIEITAANFKSIAVSGNLEDSAFASLLKELPPEKTVFSSDFGQVRNGSPVAGYQRMIDLAMRCGYTEADIEKVTEKNPARLLFGE